MHFKEPHILCAVNAQNKSAKCQKDDIVLCRWQLFAAERSKLCSILYHKKVKTQHRRTLNAVLWK